RLTHDFTTDDVSEHHHMNHPTHLFLAADEPEFLGHQLEHREQRIADFVAKALVDLGGGQVLNALHRVERGLFVRGHHVCAHPATPSSARKKPVLATWPSSQLKVIVIPTLRESDYFCLLAQSETRSAAYCRTITYFEPDFRV